MLTKKKALQVKEANLDSFSDEEEDLPSAFFNKNVKPPAFHFEIDAAALTMFVIAICTRMWRLEDPKSIVFDELHYGKFASMYMKRTFFFDSHPPLGKQLELLLVTLLGLMVMHSLIALVEIILNMFQFELYVLFLHFLAVYLSQQFIT
ncbi:Protein O-mannosyltransferase 1 like protein [Argiope bruennichi]|uniref:Protein O-mannosyltransferase 1 like protein n=1 Tax=Argiope bruennichi TaxID=94029 RepID=A0A8T0FIC5_ARGBR|nr:Protein O-mannosyltransferase 1 like protein [Argiope bruennichi]